MTSSPEDLCRDGHRAAPHNLERHDAEGGIRVWLRERIEVRAAAKIFFVRSLVIDRVLTYSEYRLPQAGVPAISDPVIP
jgi:hypothetical protein